MTPNVGVNYDVGKRASASNADATANSCWHSMLPPNASAGAKPSSKPNRRSPPRPRVVTRQKIFPAPHSVTGQVVTHRAAAPFETQRAIVPMVVD